MTETATANRTLAIERTIDLQAGPDRVWRALTDSAELASWFSQRAEVPSRAGATGWLEWDGHERFAIRIEAFEPMRRLAWSWASSTEPSFDAAASRVEWTLEPGRGAGTRLHLRETGFDSIASRFGNVQGWFEELGELRDLLATEPWQHPIRKTLHLRAARERVWQAFANPDELMAWWGFRTPVRIEPGWEGWFDFPEHGRHAVRIEAVEAPEYLSWRWSADEPDVPLDDVAQPLTTEWLFTARDDGGTDLRMQESGFTGPAKHGDNQRGWSEILPALAKLVGGEVGAD